MINHNGVNIPESEEAEKAVLGSIMIAPETFFEADSILKDANDFYLKRHRVIYQAMQAIKTRQEPLDHLTIADCLEASGDLSELGGRAYLIDLANNTPTSMHISVYATLVKRAAIRRRMMQATMEMHELATDESINIEEVTANNDRTWLKATSDVTEKRGVWMEQAASEFLDEMERAMAGLGTQGFDTGLIDVDKLLCGLSPEQLIILAGRTGMGKSAAMDNIALHLGKQGIPIFYATSERSYTQVIKRMQAIHTGINTVKIGNAKLLTRQESSRLTAAAAEISKYPIYFDDNPMPRPRDIYAQANWMVKRHGCKIILFDGMYRAKTGIPELDKDGHKKYGTIALELKTMARALQVPVLVTHQLSRNLEHRKNKRPILADLRESGRIEEEADKVIFLYRDAVYNPKTDMPNSCEWILAKHRDGPTGIAQTYFDASCTTFKNANIERDSYVSQLKFEPKQPQD